MRLLKLLLIASACALNGCASRTAPNISLDRTKTGPFTTVALLRVSESKHFIVRNLSGLPALGGMIGGLIAASVDTSRTGTFVAKYNAGSTRLSTTLVGDLQREFAANGIHVSYMEKEGAKSKDNADDYSHINADSDVILSVWLGPVGYIANGAFDAPYEPWVVVTVRLLHGKTKHVLSQKTYTAGYKSKLEGAVFVPCAADYRFDTYEKLTADFAGSLEALSECERATARQAVMDLR
ncbi:MAG: hypothetical protein JWR21_3027 [Herminiimonas sp.]|nr:hypothetical protein [Herminiimonas sp.]